MRGVTDLGFTTPTPIQAKSIPPGLARRDVLACAMTGSGKTAAFVLPLLQRLAAAPATGATRALVLVPTRELASQVHEHLVGLGRYSRVTSVTVFGGVSPFPQERALKRGVDVVVATPGRLLDHMRQGVAKFDRLELLVLDEADRMLDMGFLPDVERILSALPRQRQTMLFSATLPKEIVELSRRLLHDPARIDVERPSAPPTTVSQEVLPVPERLKPSLLLELLKRRELETALVFTRTKHRANRLADFLDAAGVPCDRIHGNRSQGQREAALAAFKAGKLQVLVATDIAARGIDISALPHVVNFDVPHQSDDYIHRVGRTARASLTGHAITFASPEDGKELAAIERAVGKRLPRRQLQGFDYASNGAKLEIPIQERIAAIRARKQEERARARAKAEAKAARGAAPASRGKSAGQPAPAARTAGGRGNGAGAPRPSHAPAAASHRPTHAGAPGNRPAHVPSRSGYPGASSGGAGQPASASGGSVNPWPGRGRFEGRRQDNKRGQRRPAR
ncbi:MAG TPA: DEAD/DEAH box helicase [Thermoanaerobaculia bacterium]|nr:DEAD/DEAH box helicase [Thermoanaerobaculia bacterium]